MVFDYAFSLPLYIFLIDFFYDGKKPDDVTNSRKLNLSEKRLASRENLLNLSECAFEKCFFFF